jgi:flagellar biosynthesis/type III secretory pathway M-ring protein FliF/YscJ
MADHDRIKEFLKLRKQVRDNPKRIAGAIRQWMASDAPANKKPKT